MRKKILSIALLTLLAGQANAEGSNICIVGAMKKEVAFLVSHLKNKVDIKIYDYDYLVGEIHGHKVVLLKYGVGKVSAATGLATMHQKYKCQSVINVGTAGGLKKVNVSDIIIATKTAYHDVDATAIGYQYGQIPHMPTFFHTDNELGILAKKASKNIGVALNDGLIVTGDSFVSDNKRKNFIMQHFPKALAVDMESAAISQTCFELSIPVAIIKAVSDSAGDGAGQVVNRNNSKKTANVVGRVVLEMLKIIK